MASAVAVAAPDVADDAGVVPQLTSPAVLVAETPTAAEPPRPEAAPPKPTAGAETPPPHRPAPLPPKPRRSPFLKMAAKDVPPAAPPAPPPAVEAPGAAAEPKPEAAPTTPVAVAPVVSDLSTAVSETLELAAGHSQIVELGVPIRDVVLSNHAVADVVVKRPNQVFVMGRVPGQTNAFFLDENGKTVRRMEIRVHVDIGTLGITLKKLFPEERIKPESVGGTVFLTGTVRSPAAAASSAQVARRFVADDASLINLLKISDEQQVLLRVRVAEVQKTTLKELGLYPTINRMAFGGFNVAPAPGAGIGLTSTSPAAYFARAVLHPSTAADFSFILQALERQGLIRTLAEPNLTAISGETAKMLAGGEFPVPTSNVNNMIGITFKPFGVALGFSPVVLAPGKISLKLSSEVSAIDRSNQVSINGTVIPGLTVRRAETSVELPSGGNLMIAGMLQNDMIEALNGLPGLKDVPILGQLFRSESFQRNESELVVMVTAYIVQPIDNNMLALPTDGLVPASDLDLMLLGRLHHVYTGGVGPPPAESLQGPVGYIID